jgi:hypothetical protein
MQGLAAGDYFDELISYNCTEGEYYWASFYDVASLAKEFGISRRGMYNILESLEQMAISRLAKTRLTPFTGRK